MNEEEIYEFDLNGYIILRDLIPPADVARMNEILDQDQAGDFPHSFQFLKLDPMFMDLMALRARSRLCAPSSATGYASTTAMGCR